MRSRPRSTLWKNGQYAIRFPACISFWEKAAILHKKRVSFGKMHKREQLQQHLVHKAGDRVAQNFSRREHRLQVDVDASGRWSETRCAMQHRKHPLKLFSPAAFDRQGAKPA